MNQDIDLNIPQRSSPTLQESPACFDPPRGVVQQVNDRTAPSLPVQLSLFLADLRQLQENSLVISST
jgi:hypothetical protein